MRSHHNTTGRPIWVVVVVVVLLIILYMRSVYLAKKIRSTGWIILAHVYPQSFRIAKNDVVDDIFARVI
jgi:hypothetical protein